MSRRVCVLIFCFVAFLEPCTAADAAPCWRPAVTGSVIDPFRPPSCPYCPGHRGIEYSVSRGTRVNAVAAGTVAWAGTIARTRYVVVRHASGWRVTYGKLAAASVSTGDTVVRGALIGTASGSFYFGVRIGADYRDPAPFIGRLVVRQRLVPVDGTRPRAVPPPRLRCGASGVPVALSGSIRPN
jgi:murein DD-endopeptidase MepM/ murein hydrolase activator NlpD